MTVPLHWKILEGNTCTLVVQSRFDIVQCYNLSMRVFHQCLNSMSPLCILCNYWIPESSVATPLDSQDTAIELFRSDIFLMNSVCIVHLRNWLLIGRLTLLIGRTDILCMHFDQLYFENNHPDNRYTLSFHFCCSALLHMSHIQER